MSPNDYLPPREPLDNPAAAAQRGNLTKTLVLWGVLIVMFVGLYNLFSKPPPNRSRTRQAAVAVAVAATRPCPEPSLLERGLPLGCAVLLIGGFIWLIRRQSRGAGQYNERVEPALMALNDGDAGRAVEIFRRVLDSYRNQAGYAATLRLNLAISLMAAGQDEVAIEELLLAERASGLLYGNEVRANAAAQLAQQFALRGDLELASRWLTDGRRRLTRAGGSSRLVTAAQLTLAEVILRCRLGEAEQARALLESHLRQLEGAFNVFTCRIAWLLGAFLEHQLAAPREAGNIERHVSMLRNARPGELAYVGQKWPEMEAFAKSRGIEAALPRRG
jgi:hypothetical protein